jgi:hypothetical protein
MCQSAKMTLLMQFVTASVSVNWLAAETAVLDLVSVTFYSGR